MIVEGALIDGAGVRRGYVRLRRGRIIETGAVGTDSSHGRERRVRGIVLPAAVNAHTHLGDAAFGREPPPGPLSRIVAPPGGMKFRILRDTPAATKEAAVRVELLRMVAEGTGAVVDFREEGLAGTELLRRAARRLPIEVIALGRPLRRPVEPSELAPILRLADGIGLSSAREEDRATREAVARACHRAGRRYALHASETTREPADSYLTPRPDLLVHMYGASTDDLDRVARAKIPIAVCPRSNALFGRSPDLARFDRAGVTFFLGTDNAMFAAPSMFREMEFAYTSQRLRRRPVSPARLIRAAFLDPWAWLRRPERARLTEENPAPPIVLRLPEDDPEYQVVARAAEHVMVAPESMGSGSGPG